jgi:hypothetical protein
MQIIHGIVVRFSVIRLVRTSHTGFGTVRRLKVRVKSMTVLTNVVFLISRDF